MREAGESLEFRRGGMIGNLLSFDVQKISSVLTVDVRASDGRASVTAALIAGSLFQIFSAGDRATLEKQMDVLVSTLKGT